MIVFVASSLGRCCADSVRRRTCLAFGGVLLVIAAGVAAFGITSGFGQYALDSTS